MILTFCLPKKVFRLSKKKRFRDFLDITISDGKKIERVLLVGYIAEGENASKNRIILDARLRDLNVFFTELGVNYTNIKQQRKFTEDTVLANRISANLVFAKKIGEKVLMQTSVVQILAGDTFDSKRPTPLNKTKKTPTKKRKRSKFSNSVYEFGSLDIDQFKKGNSIRLENVHFMPNRSLFEPVSYAELEFITSYARSS